MTDLPVVHPEELSIDAGFAFAYCQALLLKGAYEKDFIVFQAGLGRTQDDKRRMLAAGLRELVDRGLIEVERNGEGTWEPVKLLARMGRSSGLVLRDGD